MIRSRMDVTNLTRSILAEIGSGYERGSHRDLRIGMNRKQVDILANAQYSRSFGPTGKVPARLRSAKTLVSNRFGSRSADEAFADDAQALDLTRSDAHLAQKGDVAVDAGIREPLRCLRR